MKKTEILQKIRVKLIKALGGYTCPPALPQKPDKFRYSEEYKPEKLVAFYGRPDTWPVEMEYIKHMMIHEIAKAIFEGNFIQLRQGEAGFYGEIWVLRKAAGKNDCN